MGMSFIFNLNKMMIKNGRKLIKIQVGNLNPNKNGLANEEKPKSMWSNTWSFLSTICALCLKIPYHNYYFNIHIYIYEIEIFKTISYSYKDTIKFINIQSSFTSTLKDKKGSLFYNNNSLNLKHNIHFLYY